MHTEQNAPHTHKKLCPCPCSPLTPTPSTPKPHTTTLEIIQSYFIQITHSPAPLGAQIKKQKYTCRFYTKLQNSPKITPPPTPHFQHLQVPIWAPNQKSTPSILFALSNPFLNGMTQLGSFKNRKVITFQAKNQGAGQGLPLRYWVKELLTQKLLGTNLATPESFIQINPTVKKLFNNLISTKSQ